MSRMNAGPRRTIAWLSVLAGIAIAATAVALVRWPDGGSATVTAQSTACSPSETPTIGAIAGQPKPIWCQQRSSGTSTFTSGGNSWVDQFEHGLSFGDIGVGYRTFNSLGGILKADHWRHASHWMVDIAPSSSTAVGGVMMRPDRSFRWENGVLVIEAVVAAGISEYGGQAWPELVVTTASGPTQARRDALYAYEQFAGHYSLGCRLQASREPICAMYNNSTGGVGQGARTFEISFFQHEGATVTGGTAQPAWRVCQAVDADTNCRDHFRWEIRKDTLTLYVNGTKYMEHRGLPADHQIPDAFMNSDVYVYFADWIFKAPAQTVRFHWDTLAVNASAPLSTPPPAATPGSAPTQAGGDHTHASPTPSSGSGSPSNPPIIGGGGSGSPSNPPIIGGAPNNLPGASGMPLNITANGSYVHGANGIVVEGKGAVTDAVARIENQSGHRVLALWVFRGGLWRYHIPAFASLNGGLTSFDQDVTAAVAVLT